jgi:hypothetical protein
MLNWMTQRKTYDNTLALCERLAGLFCGIWVAAGNLSGNRTNGEQPSPQ